jgi:two-component system chemotaxis response regulator CheB
MHGFGPKPRHDLRDLIAIGGSAGSLGPLTQLVSELPQELPACLLVAVHSSAESVGNLAVILGRTSRLPVSIATHNRRIEPGIFVAPPDRHLLVTAGHLHVTHGPKENGFRPALDPLFRTAAHAYGRRVIGVLLSGALDDGVYGLHELKALGGLVVVQDPDDAEVASLPLNAIDRVDVDHVLTAAAIAPLLIRETGLPWQGDVAMGGTDIGDPQLPGGKTDIADMNLKLGLASGLTCPDCGGALWQIQDRTLVRFQCHVGHHYSPDSLVTQQDDRVEKALWTAVRALEERADLRRRMASQTEAAGLSAVSESFAEQAESAETEADVIRDVLTRSAARTSAVNVGNVELPARHKRRRQR